jgi:hypothetical protein
LLLNCFLRRLIVADDVDGNDIRESDEVRAYGYAIEIINASGREYRLIRFGERRPKYNHTSVQHSQAAKTDKGTSQKKLARGKN